MWILVALLAAFAVGAGVFWGFRLVHGAGPAADAPVELVIEGAPYLKTRLAFDHVDFFLGGELKAQWDELPAGDHTLPADVAATVESAIQNRTASLSVFIEATRGGVSSEFTMDMMPARGRGRAIASSFSNPSPSSNAGNK